MKKKKNLIFYLIRLFLFLGVLGCSGPQEKVDSTEIRKNAEKGMQDLRMEEERHKH